MVINITIKPASDVCDITATAYGDITEVISDKEREMFINDTHIKKIIQILRINEKQMKGKPPGIMNRVPPWSNIYLQYDWHEVRITWRPVKTEIINMDVDKIDVASHFSNNSKKAAKFTADMREDLNRIKTSWETTQRINKDSKTDYIVRIQECSGVGLPSSSIEVQTDPGQKFMANLRFTRYVIELKVTYEASLQGYIACSFKDWFKTCHRKYKAIDVLEAANLPTTAASSEVIKIYFYADGTLSLSEV